MKRQDLIRTHRRELRDRLPPIRQHGVLEEHQLRPSKQDAPRPPLPTRRPLPPIHQILLPLEYAQLGHLDRGRGGPGRREGFTLEEGDGTPSTRSGDFDGLGFGEGGLESAFIHSWGRTGVGERVGLRRGAFDVVAKRDEEFLYVPSALWFKAKRVHIPE